MREGRDFAIASAMRPTLSLGVGRPLASLVHVVPESMLRQMPHPGPYARRYDAWRMRVQLAQNIVSGWMGLIATSHTPVLSFTNSTWLQLSPPSSLRYR